MREGKLHDSGGAVIKDDMGFRPTPPESPAEVSFPVTQVTNTDSQKDSEANQVLKEAELLRLGDSSNSISKVDKDTLDFAAEDAQEMEWEKESEYTFKENAELQEDEGKSRDDVEHASYANHTETNLPTVDTEVADLDDAEEEEEEVDIGEEEDDDGSYIENDKTEESEESDFSEYEGPWSTKPRAKSVTSSLPSRQNHGSSGEPNSSSSSETDFRCDSCDIQFSRAHQLKSHMKMHLK
jgi:hypothetical protein